MKKIMKKIMSKILILLLSFGMMLPFCVHACAANYVGISLDIPWFCQRRWGDCGIASLAMIEGFYMGGCEDNDVDVYNAVYNYNNRSVKLSDYSYLGYSVISNDLSAIYSQLKNGNPVLVYRINSSNEPHFSVIYGYNGSSAYLEKSGFLVRHTYKHDNDYTIRPAGNASWTNLESWLSGCSWEQTVVRTASKIPMGGSSPAVTVTGSKESLDCPFIVTLPANTRVELYYSENKTNYAGTINDNYSQTFESKWEIYLSDGSTEYYIYYGGNYYYLVAVDGVTAQIVHSSTYWTTFREPTCSKNGLKKEVCRICDKTLTIESIPEIAHTPEDDWTVITSATCSSAGLKEKYCSVCGELTNSEMIPEIGHSYDEWIIVTQPTDSSVGEKVRYCYDCGESEYEIIPELIDKGNIVLGKDYLISGNGVPTAPYTACLTDGVVEYDVCNEDSWFGFNSGNIVDGIGTITFCFEDTYNISSVRIHYGCNWDWGVCEPKEIKLFVSDDGVNYDEYSEIFDLIPCQAGEAFTAWTYLSEIENLKGKYMKFEFTINGSWCWINEIEVQGELAVDEFENENGNGNENENDTSNGNEENGIETGTDGLIYELRNDGTYYAVIGYNGTDPNVVIPSKYKGVPVTELYHLGHSDLITSIHIPDSIVYIEGGCFIECQKIKEIYIPASVKYMGPDVFWRCFGLTDIYCEAESRPDGWDGAWLWSYQCEWGDYSDENITVHWGCNSSDEKFAGDINGNDKIDMTDYILLKRAYFGTYKFTETQNKVGDINKNNKIDMTDYILLKRVYFGTYTIK